MDARRGRDREPTRSLLLGGALRGAAAGALGTTALNALTYADMALRGRPASTAPEETIRAALATVGVEVPGDARQRQSRLSALGALGGLVTGSALGAVLGAGRAIGFRPSALVGSLVATVLAMGGANTPLTVLRVSDPREWSVQDWVADVLPHLAYGVVTEAVLRRSDA